MLCVYRQAMRRLGYTEEQLERLNKLFPSTGLLACHLQSFNGSGEGRPSGKSPAEWLASEPAESRRLCLVGMADAYGNGRQVGPVEIRQIDGKDFDKEALRNLLSQYGWQDKEAAAAILFP